jgi:hypothetical protein
MTHAERPTATRQGRGVTPFPLACLFTQGWRIIMGEGRRRAARDTFLQQALYDDLFAKDPPTANMVLLILEIEDYYKSRGVKPSIGNFTGTGEQLSNFMIKNKDMLIQQFERRFPDPSAYLFPGKIKNSGSILRAPLMAKQS